MGDRDQSRSPSPSDDEAARGRKPRRNGSSTSGGSDRYLRIGPEADDEEAQLLSPGAFHLDYAEEGDGGGDADRENDDDDLSSVPSGLLAKFAARRRRDNAGRPRRRTFSAGDRVGASEYGAFRRFLTRLRLYGPARKPPQIHAISPILPAAQEAPARWLAAKLPHSAQRAALLCLFLCVWAAAFAVCLGLSNAAGEGATDGEGRPLVHLGCGDVLWERNNGCGLDGEDCRPFSNSSIAFHCPPGCAGVMLLEPRSVGAEQVNYRPLVVGSQVYRGDSFMCAAAIHSGVVTQSGGGCGVVERVGPAQGFRASTANGIESVPFDSYFPLAFTVKAASDAGLRCGDPNVPRGALLLLLNVFFSSLLSLFTTSPSALFFPCFVALFAHVSLVSDPSGGSRHSTNILAERVSNFAEQLLPSLFVAAVLYRFFVRRALGEINPGSGTPRRPPPAPPLEKTLLWLGFFWVGSLSNYTLGWLPIQRLTAHDLEQQPGAKAALAIIIVLLFFAAVQQGYHLWLEGRLPQFLGMYLLQLLGILVGLAVPGLELRLHHYIMGLMMLPGTAMQTRPSLAYQGLLLGLFVNGVARWGFASILQTADALRGDGAFGSALPALLAAPLIRFSGSGISSISFQWAPPPPLVDGVSVLVNDVERHRAFFAEPDVGGPTGGAAGFVWARQQGVELPEYFRFGFLRDGVALDYTRAGVWNANGTWTPMEPS